MIFYQQYETQGKEAMRNITKRILKYFFHSHCEKRSPQGASDEAISKIKVKSEIASQKMLAMTGSSLFFRCLTKLYHDLTDIFKNLQPERQTVRSCPISGPIFL